MLASPLRVLVSMAIPVFAGLLVSCVSLEFDRMTGTAFPTSQTVNGQTVTLSSIFDEGDLLRSISATTR